jgi:hypothetical protein
LGKVDRIDLAGLARHERAVARDLELLGVPAPNWPAKIVDASGQPVLDVLIVGAGMNGIAAAGSLMFKGVRNIAVIERSRPGQEGPAARNRQPHHQARRISYLFSHQRRGLRC